MRYIKEETNFEKAARKEGFERFTSIYGMSGWKKDGKFYIWNGNYNPNAEGYAAQNLQEVTPPQDFYTTQNLEIKNTNGNAIGIILWAGGCIIGTAALTALGILVFSNPTSAIGAGLLASLLLKQQKAESKELFLKAQSAQPIVIDPILVDLNGDGIKTTTLENGVYFDHGKDGFAESSAWVDENDGILVIDKNNNGFIDDGSEIFGDNYVKSNGNKASNGFDALRDLDSNNDGIISVEDENFGLIKILKGDGSLISLEEAGIVSINLNSTAKNTVDENGNTLVSQGTFVKSDGSVGNLGDFNLVVDKMNSFATEWLDESEDIAALPEVLGSGTVYSLHQAMVRDESGVLKGLVEEFISAAGNVAKKNILLQILYKWTGADSVVDGSRGSNFNAKKLHVLEQFIGKGFVGTNGSNPHAQAAPILNNAFTSLMNNIYASLMSQTELKDVFNKLEIVYDTDTETVSYDLSKVREYIDNLIVEDEITGKNLLADFTQSFINLGLKDNSNYEEYYNYYVSKGDDYIDVCDFDYYLNRDNNRKVA